MAVLNRNDIAFMKDIWLFYQREGNCLGELGIFLPSYGRLKRITFQSLNESNHFCIGTWKQKRAIAFGFCWKNFLTGKQIYFP